MRTPWASANRKFVAKDCCGQLTMPHSLLIHILQPNRPCGLPCKLKILEQSSYGDRYACRSLVSMLGGRFVCARRGQVQTESLLQKTVVANWQCPTACSFISCSRTDHVVFLASCRYLSRVPMVIVMLAVASSQMLGGRFVCARRGQVQTESLLQKTVVAN